MKHNNIGGHSPSVRLIFCAKREKLITAENAKNHNELKNLYQNRKNS